MFGAYFVVRFFSVILLCGCSARLLKTMLCVIFVRFLFFCCATFLRYFCVAFLCEGLAIVSAIFVRFFISFLFCDCPL